MQTATELHAYLRCGGCIMHKARNASESIINEPKLHLGSMYNLSVCGICIHTAIAVNSERERALQAWPSRLDLSD